MGLFRRGTKLLRLGSGLRDCCCRPEKPEECWCPDWCRYYWDWGGTTIFPAREYLKNSCETGGIDQTVIFEGYDSFGFLETVLNFDASVFFGASSANLFWSGDNGIGFSRGFYIDGFVSEAAQEEIFGVAYPQVFGWYSVVSGLDVKCDIDSSTGRAGGFSLFAYNLIDIKISYPGLSIPYYVHLVHQYVRDPSEAVNESVSLNADAECQTNNELFCVSQTLGDGLSRLHLTEDLEFVFSETGITVNGTLYEWQEEPLGLYGGLPIIDNRDDTDLWKVAGDFPFEATVTLKRRDSCRPSTCDCTRDLTGRTVVFEGKNFTYGAFETIQGDTDYIFWTESVGGVFVYQELDPCAPTSSGFPLITNRATLTSETVDDVEQWGVVLEHFCVERDDCDPAPNAWRVRQVVWAGVFSCAGDGYPAGIPNLTLISDETTNGPMAGDCVEQPEPPSISMQ